MGLDGVELVLEVEDEFETKIPDDVAERILTVRDLVDWLMADEHSMKAREMGRDRVLLKICEISAEQMGLKIEKVLEESRFAQDLGMS